MPVQDWTRVDAGLFHHFHQRWISALSDALNEGILPADYFALAEQNIRRPIPDVLTLKLGTGGEKVEDSGGGVAVAAAPPKAALVRRNETDKYAENANRIAVRHQHGDVVSVIEIISPRNKGSKAEFNALVRKSTDLIRQGVHLLVVDLFPKSRRDPEGLPKANWDEFEDECFDLAPDKPLMLASFDAGPPRVIYVEPVAVGNVLPDLPVFLKPEFYVPAPLEATYQTAWQAFPNQLKGLLG